MTYHPSDPVTLVTFQHYTDNTYPYGVPVWTVVRQVGDAPATVYTLTENGEISNRQLDDIAAEPAFAKAMDSARTHATATGSVSGTLVEQKQGEQARFVAQWIRPQTRLAEPEEPHLRPSIPLADRSLETIYSLVAPSHFDGNAVIGSFFRPGDFGQLHAHLVIYYTGPVHWAAARVLGTATSYGVGWVEYDDDAQRARPRSIARDITYGRAIELFHAEIAKLVE